MARSVEPDIHRHRALGHPQATKSFCDERQPRAEPAARERIALAFAWSDKQLVGLPARERAEQDEAVALGDDANPLLDLLRQHAAEHAAALVLLCPALLGDERRLVRQPDE